MEEEEVLDVAEEDVEVVEDLVDVEEADAEVAEVSVEEAEAVEDLVDAEEAVDSVDAEVEVSEEEAASLRIFDLLNHDFVSFLLTVFFFLILEMKKMNLRRLVLNLLMAKFISFFLNHSTA